jgi:large subunit ribosomal protein L28
MSKVCQLTGKRPITGNNVSHSNRKTKRRFLPNLHKKRFYIPETDQWVTLKVSSSALRTINKLGIFAYLKKLERQGVQTGVKLNIPNK